MLTPDERAALPSDLSLWDAVVSYLGALEGDDHPAWWFERPIRAAGAPEDTASASGSGEDVDPSWNDLSGFLEDLDASVAPSERSDHEDAAPPPAPAPLYSLRARIGGREQSLQDLLGTLPEDVRAALVHRGWAADLWNARVEESVQTLLQEASWNAVRDPAAGVVRACRRRPPPRTWSFVPVLNRAYWERVVRRSDETPHAPGLPGDQWARRLRAILSEEPTSESEALAAQMLRTTMRQRGAWEFHAQQSFRMWAAGRPAWTPLLDMMHVSHQVVHEGAPLVTWAIERGWADGVRGWLRDAQATLGVTPRADQMPASWTTPFETPPSGSLWHWCCRHGTAALLEDLLAERPDLIDERASNNQTGAHWACAAGRVDLIPVLVAHGTDLSAEDSEGSIPAQLVPPGLDDLFERLEDARQRQPAPLVRPAPSSESASGLSDSSGVAPVRLSADGLGAAPSSAGGPPSSVESSGAAGPNYDTLLPDF